MINENEKQNYKNIKAPDGLKTKILVDAENIAPAKSKKNIYRYVQAVAACLVVLLGIGFVGTGLSSSVVYVDGDVFYGDEITIKPSVPSLASQRSAVSGSQVVEIDCKVETEISAEGAGFTLLDGESGQIIYTGNEYSVKGKVVIVADVPAGEESVLTLKNILSEREILLKATSF